MQYPFEGALEALQAAFKPLTDLINEFAPQIARLDYRHLMRRKIRRMVRQ